VNAEVTVGSIVIQGTVRGNITAKRSVEIHSPGRVRGNINTPSLFIEKGVFFDGNCQMDASPAASESAPASRHKKSASVPTGTNSSSSSSGS
jgi:cytoskeletal protein CcmA (bactofilin family)